MTIGKSGPWPGGQAEERGVVAPRLDRDLDPDRPGEARRPGAGDVDDDRRGEPAAVGLDPDDGVALDDDRTRPGSPGRTGRRGRAPPSRNPAAVPDGSA